MDLSRFDRDFEAAEAKEVGEISPLKDGRYTVLVDGAELTQTKAGTDCFKLTFKVVEGPNTGRLIWKYHLISPERMGFLKTDLVLMGLNLRKFSELPGRLKELLDIHLEITLKTKNENQNVYINKRLKNTRAKRPPDEFVGGISGQKLSYPTPF